MLKYNKGEWSEVYTLFKLLSDGFLETGDEKLNILPMFKHTVLSVKMFDLVFELELESDKVLIKTIDNQLIASESRVTFQNLMSITYESILNNKRTFEIEQVDDFLQGLGVSAFKSNSTSKKDIEITVYDSFLDEVKTYSFNIKSELGSKPTLLNASNSTNFQYEITSLDYEQKILLDNINKENDKSWLKHKIRKLCDLVKNGDINFKLLKLNDIVFQNNLNLINEDLQLMLSNILLDYYSHMKISDLSTLVLRLSNKDPLEIIEIDSDYYSNVVKSFLESITFGMIPSKKWDNNITNDGILIVKKDGELVNLHRFHNSVALRNYLFENTRLETPSTSRYNIGSLIKSSTANKYYLCLNLQIRMK